MFIDRIRMKLIICQIFDFKAKFVLLHFGLSVIWIFDDDDRSYIEDGKTTIEVVATS